ncbi:MAG: DUF2971 domain-containing protein [Syntrophobacteraceae bacterium]
MAPPQHVIRFYRANRALETIESKQITFVHADKLNDPFDPNFDFQTNFNDDYRILSNYVKRTHKSHYDKFKEGMSEANWVSFLEDINNRLIAIRNSAFVFSTIEVDVHHHPRDNLYMWSHYGDGHRGVAIEFDSAILRESVLNKQRHLKGEELDEPWSKVIYLKELPLITCEHIFDFIINDTPIVNEEAWLKTKLAKTMMLAYVSKSAIWKPEREWRLMWQNDETNDCIEKCDLINGAVTAIYLGLRIEDAVKAELFSNARRNFPNARVFQSKKKKGKFALELERI